MSAAAPPPPSAADLAANQGPGIIAANLTVAILATIAVALRFTARWKAGIKADDWLILAALPFGWGMCACTLISELRVVFEPGPPC